MNDLDVVELTRQLVRIPSLTNGERDVALYLRSVMEPIFDQVTVDEVNNVVGVLEGRQPGPTVLFNGHIDTVDPGAMENAYSGQLVDAARFGGSGQAVYGRGACDMKGGIAAMVGAAAVLCSGGFQGRLIMMAATLEEPGQGEGTNHAMKALEVKPEVAISGEATRGDICLGHRGKVELDVEVQGRTSHASNPSRGLNAILLMNRFLGECGQLQMPDHPIVDRCTWTVTDITASPGRMAVVPDRCNVVFDNRFLPGESPDRPQQDVTDLLERLHASDPAFVYKVRRLSVMPAYLVPPENPYVSLMSKVVSEIRGAEPIRRGWLFGTDGMYLVNKWGIPTVGFGPGDERFAHTPMEHVPVADLLSAMQVYVEFVRRLGTSRF